MPIALSLEIDNPVITTHESLTLSCELRNDTDVPVMLPGPYDQSSVLTFEFYTADGVLARRMSGLTHQAMLTSSRVDRRPMLEELQAGAKWTRTLDLANYHYPLSAGAYTLVASFEYEEADVSIRSEKHRVRVAEAPVEAVHAVRDDCILDGLSMVVRAEVDGSEGYYLRRYNHRRPLASWYSRPILPHARSQQLFTAAAAYFRTESFDHFFDSWVLWRQAGTLHAQTYRWGRAASRYRSAAVPQGRQVVPYAFVTGTNMLYVFMLTQQSMLECYRFDASELRRVFAHPVQVASPEALSLGVDAEHVHVLTHGSGRLVYERLRHTGESLDRRQLYETSMPLYACRYDAVDGRAQATFVDRGERTTVRVAGVAVDDGAVREQTIRLEREHGGVTEVSAAQDRKGRFHTLVAAGAGHLFYVYQDRDLQLLRQSDEPSFPYVIAAGEVFLGYYSRREGYRFRHVARGRPDFSLVDYDYYE